MVKRKTARMLSLALLSGLLAFGFAGQEIPIQAAEEAGLPIRETEAVPETDAAQEAEAEPAYLLGRPLTEEEEQAQRELFTYYQGLGGEIIPPAVQLGENTLPDSMGVNWGVLPAQYDSRDRNIVPEIRDQNPYGDCWSFSSIACLEINLIKNGLVGLDIDLSELHLAFYSNYSAPDPLDNDGGAVSYFDSSKAGGVSYLNRGGNQTMAADALMNWKGAVDEALVTEDMALAGLDTEGTLMAYGHDICYLSNWYQIPSGNQTVVKDAIMQYGAVAANYYSSDAYYNFSTAAEYCPDTGKGTNHGVTIIGWDDSYRKENFKTPPSQDGAWLVRNSWGTWFGDDGYFWLSYEDQSIAAVMYTFEGVESDVYDNNYQYDHTTYTGWISVVKAANVFTAKANESRLEQLEAVSILLYNAGVRYSLQIYTNLTDPANPESGTPALSVPQTGVTRYAGYYTIPLEEKINLEPGDTFALVFELNRDSEEQPYVGCEYARRDYRYSETAAEPGESFCVSRAGYGWYDFGQRNDSSLRIKAYTSNTDIESTGYMVRAFVKRMYTTALGRQEDVAGLRDWTERLKSQKIDGAGLAYGFICSDEFALRGLSDSDYIDTLYRTFFDREADAVGKDDWMQHLVSGHSREYVLSGFVNSTEFGNLCDRYQIARGTMQEDGNTVYRAGVRDFVLRLYTKALNREGETEGVEDWTNRINMGIMSAEDVAKDFFHSEEFQSKNHSDEEYIKILYRTFMGREYDNAGLADWLNALAEGHTRDEVMAGFSRSVEFHDIMAEYGL